MKRFAKRTLAVLICFTMVLSACSTAFAVSTKTEQFAKKAAVAGIKKAAGAIPYVGGGVSYLIDSFLPDMLGIKGGNDAVMAKLDEIYDSIQNLSLQMDDNQQKLFEEFYQLRISDFNTDANKLKGTIDRLYTLVRETEKKYGDDEDLTDDEKTLREYQKQVQLANLIKSNDFGDATSAISQLINLTDYICGTQISNGREDGIFQLVYKANCSDSVLGCEAALKSAAYVNGLSQYMETAYKTLFTIYAAKLYLCENCDAISAEMADGSIPKSNMSDYTYYDIDSIKNAVFGDSRSSLLSCYNMLFDDGRADSAINIYNNMLEDVWFCYIAEKPDYQQKPAKVKYIPLDSEMGFLAPADASFRTTTDMNYATLADLITRTEKSSQTGSRYGSYYNVATTLNYEMLEKAHSTLSAEQTERLLLHMANNPAFGTDKEELSYIQILEDLGFSFSAYNAYVDSLPKSSGVIYRDPDLPRAMTDNKLKLFPIKAECRYDKGHLFPEGWCGSVFDGYNFIDSANSGEPVKQAELIRVCIDPKSKNDKLGDYVMSNMMILYFAADESSGTASFFSRTSAATIPIICVGAVLIVAAPVVILLARKKKKNAAEDEGRSA